MKKISIIIIAAILFGSCANSPSNENGAVDSSANVPGTTDTTGGYKANSGNVNIDNSNTMVDSGKYDTTGRSRK